MIRNPVFWTNFFPYYWKSRANDWLPDSEKFGQNQIVEFHSFQIHLRKETLFCSQCSNKILFFVKLGCFQSFCERVGILKFSRDFVPKQKMILSFPIFHALRNVLSPSVSFVYQCFEFRLVLHLAGMWTLLRPSRRPSKRPNSNFIWKYCWTSKFILAWFESFLAGKKMFGFGTEMIFEILEEPWGRRLELCRYLFLASSLRPSEGLYILTSLQWFLAFCIPYFSVGKKLLER